MKSYRYAVDLIIATECRSLYAGQRLEDALLALGFTQTLVDEALSAGSAYVSIDESGKMTNFVTDGDPQFVICFKADGGIVHYLHLKHEYDPQIVHDIIYYSYSTR